MRKYIKEHSVKALQSFEETMGKGKYFGKPLDIHIKDYLKPFGSRKTKYYSASWFKR